MADLSRLYDFTSGQVIKSAEVDDELDQLVAGHNDHEDRLEILGTYRNLLAVSGEAGSSDSAAVTYLFGSTPGSVGDGLDSASGGDAIAKGIYFDDADGLIAGKAQKLRVRAQAFVNTVAPARTLTVGLYSIASIGGSSFDLTYGLTLVSGSTVAFASPAASSRNQGNSGDLAIPADGYYALGVSLSGALVNGSKVVLAAQLQTRHV